MIVTGRARWIILLCVLAAVFALFRQHVLLFRLAIATLIWIGFEWAAFRYRCDIQLNSSTVERDVLDRQGSTRVLWATRSAQVHTKFHATGGLLARLLQRAPAIGKWPLLPAVRATVHDLLPTGVEHVGGVNGQSFALGNVNSVELNYLIRPQVPGVVQFNGLRFVLEDLHGFFIAERFFPAPRQIRVMPLAMDLGMVHTIRKRANALPPPGLHTVGKAGPGSELMEIREYQPGDPPRSIAWKVSARRDELMCKQFESEVPVRCQLLVDMSRRVRLGYPGPCLGGQMVNVAATIAFTLTAYRDPVGISFFDGSQIQVTQASASRRATLRAIDALCDALHRPIEPVNVPPEPLIRSGYDIARMRYPAAMQYAERSLASWWPARATTRIRRRVAAILANHYRMPQHAMGELEGDDRAISYWLQRFHIDHGAPYTGPLHDEKGGYLFADPAKIEQLAQLLQRRAAKGRDNELFVILAELTDRNYNLTPLREAIKYAKARHHRVAVLAAWPPKMAGPDQENMASTHTNLNSVLQNRKHQLKAYKQLRSEFGKLGVPVAAAAEDIATVMILNQLEIIRTGRAVA